MVNLLLQNRMLLAALDHRTIMILADNRFLLIGMFSSVLQWLSNSVVTNCRVQTTGVDVTGQSNGQSHTRYYADVRGAEELLTTYNNSIDFV